MMRAIVQVHSEDSARRKQIDDKLATEPSGGRASATIPSAARDGSRITLVGTEERSRRGSNKRMALFLRMRQ
jgi:hypothetical protein